METSRLTPTVPNLSTVTASRHLPLYLHPAESYVETGLLCVYMMKEVAGWTRLRCDRFLLNELVSGALSSR